MCYSPRTPGLGRTLVVGGAGTESNACASPWSETFRSATFAPSGPTAPARSAPPSALRGRVLAAPPTLAPARQSGQAPRRARGCAGRLRPSAAGRGPGGARGTPCPPPGTAQVRAEAAGLWWGSAPITQTGKVRGCVHSFGRERGAVGCTLPLGGAHPAVNASSGPGPLRSPAGAPAELKPGSECPEARRLRLAARQPRCAPFPNGGRLGVMRGMAARRTWGNRKRPYLGEILGFLG